MSQVAQTSLPKGKCVIQSSVQILVPAGALTRVTFTGTVKEHVLGLLPHNFV